MPLHSVRRVGFVEPNAVVTLPSSVEELFELYEMEKNTVTAPPWDFMWSSVVDEGREKQFLSHSFTRDPETITAETVGDDAGTAEAALKVRFHSFQEGKLEGFSENTDGLWNTNRTL